MIRTLFKSFGLPVPKTKVRLSEDMADRRHVTFGYALKTLEKVGGESFVLDVDAIDGQAIVSAAVTEPRYVGLDYTANYFRVRVNPDMVRLERLQDWVALTGQLRAFSLVAAEHTLPRIRVMYWIPGGKIQRIDAWLL